MKELEKDIKTGTYQGVYLLHGEEPYLQQKYKTLLMKALDPASDTMNVTRYEGRNTEPAAVIDMGETLPFFAERRVLLLEDTGFFKNACDLLPEYLSKLPEYLVLVFSEKEVDKRNRMYKAVKKYGRVVEFKKQTERELVNWILRRLKKEGKQITEKDLLLFLSRTGDDMNRIRSELEKLLAYCMEDEVITREAILAVTTQQLENKIFDMIEAITQKRQKEALDMYYDLLALKEPPLKILSVLARQFNLLLQVRELSARKLRQDEIAAALGVHPYRVKLALPVAGRYSLKQLRERVEDMVELETAVKTGQLGDVLSVELAIVRSLG